MRADELEIRATLTLGREVMRGFRGRYASLDNYFLDYPNDARVAVLANGAGIGLFMFEPNEDNTHLCRERSDVKACARETCHRIAHTKGLCEPHYRKERDPKTCSTPECFTTVYARGLCSRHYQQQRAQTAKPCSTPDCAGATYARGLCNKHYQQFRLAERGLDHNSDSE